MNRDVISKFSVDKIWNTWNSTTDSRQDYAMKSLECWADLEFVVIVGVWFAAVLQLKRSTTRPRRRTLSPSERRVRSPSLLGGRFGRCVWDKGRETVALPLSEERAASGRNASAPAASENPHLFLFNVYYYFFKSGIFSPCRLAFQSKFGQNY